jgi:hypothetical protein
VLHEIPEPSTSLLAMLGLRLFLLGHGVLTVATRGENA